MMDHDTSWRRIHEDGAEWETRVIAGPSQVDAGTAGQEELLEFVCVDGSRKSRQVAVPAGAYPTMDESELHRAFVKSRPIGGDTYGRPGKRMNDAG